MNRASACVNRTRGRGALPIEPEAMSIEPGAMSIDPGVSSTESDTSSIDPRAHQSRRSAAQALRQIQILSGADTPRKLCGPDSLCVGVFFVVHISTQSISSRFVLTPASQPASKPASEPASQRTSEPANQRASVCQHASQSFSQRQPHGPASHAASQRVSVIKPANHRGGELGPSGMSGPGFKMLSWKHESRYK